MPQCMKIAEDYKMHLRAGDYWQKNTMNIEGPKKKHDGKHSWEIKHLKENLTKGSP